jgi:hypothetical protein
VYYSALQNMFGAAKTAPIITVIHVRWSRDYQKSPEYNKNEAACTGKETRTGGTFYYPMFNYSGVFTADACLYLCITNPHLSHTIGANFL